MGGSALATHILNFDNSECLRWKWPNACDFSIPALYYSDTRPTGPRLSNVAREIHKCCTFAYTLGYVGQAQPEHHCSI